VNYLELVSKFIFLIVGIPLALCLLLIILYFAIIFWNAIVFGLLGYFGIAASAEVDGIRLSNRANTINQLLLWQDISEVSEVFQPPVSHTSILLKSGKSLLIHFQVDPNIELALKEQNIPVIKRN
jgi:hypothetical protein